MKNFKQTLHSPVFWICAGGYAFLAAVYILWLRSTYCSTWGKLLALASVAAFSTVCLRFVPGWVRSWTPGELTPGKIQEKTPANTLPKIFISLLLYCMGIILLVYILRGIMGHGWSFSAYLPFWRCTDSQHYLDIARDWYIPSGDWDRMVQLVFLPGYPIAVRAMSLLLGDFLISGLAVSALCFAGTGCLLYLLVKLDFGPTHALRAVKYLCLLPGTFFFAAPMSESLFMLLCAGSLYSCRKKHWLAACALGALASFTRSLGMALFVPLLFELVTDTVNSHKKRPYRFAYLLIVPLGFAAYCYINYLVSGDPFKYMEYQSVHWGQNLGWFFNTTAYQLDNAIARFGGDGELFWGLWLPNLLAQAAALGLMIPSAKRLRPGYTAWFIAYYAVAIGATWLLSAPRYLAGLIVMPMALAALTGSRRSDAIATFMCAVLAFAYILAFSARWQVW